MSAPVAGLILLIGVFRMKNERPTNLTSKPDGALEAVDDLKIEYLPPSALAPHPTNAKLHSKRQIAQIKKSFEAFGVINPVIIDDNLNVVCGHGRSEAAKQLGLPKIPCIRITHLTEAEARAYRLADNKIADNADWDNGLLKIELDSIVELNGNFDLELTGFDVGEIDIVLTTDAPPETEHFAEPNRDIRPISREGDLWIIGDHRLYCGDCLNETSWQSLMAGEQAQMVFTDPPYNVPINGHVSGLGKVSHREFAMASGEMSRIAFVSFLRSAMGFLVAYSCDGAIHYVCMDWRHAGEMNAAAEGVYHEQKNLCIWAKTNAGMGSFYRSQHELVFVFKVGSAPHINNFGLGESGRHRSNLWTYPGVNTFRPGREDDLRAHPTVKPIAMVRDAILDCSKRGGIILDAFAGAGTTLIAAARTGRRGFGIEIDPHYADHIVQRLEAETGEQAMHGRLNTSFSELSSVRTGGNSDE